MSENNTKKAVIVSLGCPKNLVDSEIIANELIEKGYEITVDQDKAHIAVVNTCAFIQPAVSEAIEAILNIASHKKTGVLEKIIVAGCLVQRYGEQIMDQLPEVDICLGIDHIKDIGDISQESERKCYSCESKDIEFLNRPRKISENKGYTYVKISEGCKNRCTYCAIPMIRGSYRSRRIEDILKEVINLSQQGIKEIILIAQDTAAYGIDLYGKNSLNVLLKELSNVDGIKWIRLLYCYPESITDELIMEMKDNNKVLKYIDMPFQHASDKILRLMGRKWNLESNRQLIKKLRSSIKDIVIRTTFITGFPGEEEEDFEILKNFIREVRFNHAGVFPYYREEGTPAYNFKGQVPKRIREKRKDELLHIQKDIAYENTLNRLNRTYDIIIEGVSDDGIFYEGRSYAEAPEIDGVIYVASSEPLYAGQMVTVKILNVHDYSLIGEVQ